MRIGAVLALVFDLFVVVPMRAEARDASVEDDFPFARTEFVDGREQSRNENADQIGALRRAVLPRDEQCIDVRDLGADPKGKDDSAKAFQIAIDESANSDKVACVPAGRYRISSQLSMPSGSHLAMHRRAILMRADGHQGVGSRSAMIRSPNHQVKHNNVIIEGGQLTATFDGTDSGGRMIDWLGNNWIVRNLIIQNWAHAENRARAISYVGDANRIVNVTVLNPGCGIGCGGIIVAGGNGHEIRNSKVVAGDDPIAIFPTAGKQGTNPLLANRPITNVQIDGIVAKSTHARALAIGLHCTGKNKECPGFNVRIDGISVSNYRGETDSKNVSAMSLLVANRSPEGIVSNIEFDNVHIKNKFPLRHGWKLTDDGGSLANITISNSSYRGKCARSALLIRKVDDVVLFNNRFVASRDCELELETVGSSLKTANAPL